MNTLQYQTRRHFFSRCGVGLGSMALSSLMAREDALAPKKTHFPAKAKNVIFLFMAGGPSQLEMFEHKPLLTQLNGKTATSKGSALPSWTAAIAVIC